MSRVVYRSPVNALFKNSGINTIDLIKAFQYTEKNKERCHSLLAVNQFESLSVGIDNDASHKIVFAAICPKRLRNISQKLLHLFLFPDILSLIIRNSIELLKCRIERQICKLDLVILVHISGPHSIFMYIAKYIIEGYSGQALAFESTDKPPENLHNSNSTLKTSSIGISLRPVIWIIPATASMRLTSPVTFW